EQIPSGKAGQETKVLIPFSSGLGSNHAEVCEVGLFLRLNPFFFRAGFEPLGSGNVFGSGH
ncbi:MAG: hypothetical protein L0H83_07140, partial [Salinisphaera sp.]|nr:hypothetical protein [Salinisphaera sp.]